jgi:septation ring formation regulator EzrA
MEEKKEKEHEERKEKDRKHLREEYSKLKEKYSLPDYEALNRDFEIENIESDENILREILREIHNRVEFYSGILEGLIQPDSKLCDMKEAGNLGEEDQVNITEIYRKCMLINRTLLLSNLDYAPESAAKEISEISKEWQSIKKELKLILSKMRDTWKQEGKKEAHGGYYG